MQFIASYILYPSPLIISLRLWQPLSPSKNKLMAFLNSAEFQNIEEPPPAEQKTESFTPPEISHKTKEKRKEKIKDTSHAKEKGKRVSSDVDNDLKPAKPVVDELDMVPARPRRKGNGKVPETVKSTSRKKQKDSGPKSTQSSCVALFWMVIYRDVNSYGIFRSQ